MAVASVRYVREQLDRFETTQGVVAAFANIDPAAFSLAMHGHKSFSPEAQRAILNVFLFFADLMSRADRPPSLRDPSKLRPLWEQWLASQEERNFVRTRSESSSATGE